jgi:hypothetical protein
MSVSGKVFFLSVTYDTTQTAFPDNFFHFFQAKTGRASDHSVALPVF